jgi:type VI secretion system secreted protein Hcp
MGFDCFLKIEGIPGESTDDKHKDQIEILSYSHGVKQASSGSASTAGGRGSQRCDHEDFTIVHDIDKSSPKLALFCCNGKHIPSIVMEICRATGDKQKYMEYKLSDAIVSSVRPAGSSKEEKQTIPLEQVSFSYGKIEWTYTATDHKTGKAAGDVKAHWDLTANKGG